MDENTGFESNPMWVLLGEALSELPNTPTRELDAAVFSAIAEHANSKGRAFPSIRTIARKIGRSRMDVWRSVQRLIKLGWLTKEKVKGARFEHCVYMIASRFLRKTVNMQAKHFDAAKWERWINYAKTMGDYMRKYTVGVVKKGCDIAQNAAKPVFRFTIARLLRDLADKGFYGDRLEKAENFVLSHSHDTCEEYEKTLGEAVEMAKHQPVWDTVSKPTSSAPADLEPVSEPVSSASADSVLQSGTPIEWEDGSTWLTDPLTKDTQAMPVKQETNLNTLPANTTSAVDSANTANTVDSANVQTNMTNAPKFINGEVDSRWETQQLLHELNPTMYPAY